jgi:hypothetical protein
MPVLLPVNAVDWLSAVILCFLVFWSSLLPWLIQDWRAKRAGMAGHAMSLLHRLLIVCSAAWFVVLIAWRLVVMVRGHW